MTNYIDQSAKDLRFYLVQGAVDVSSLTIIAAAKLRWKNRQVEMGILGASHFLSVTSDGGTPLYEVFACAELNTDGPFLKCGPLGQLQATVQAMVGDLEYVFRPRLLSWTAGEAELRGLIEKVSAAKAIDQCGLSFEFPSIIPGGLKPLTLVYCDTTLDLRLQTVHCYPNEGTMVITETYIKEGTKS